MRRVARGCAFGLALAAAVPLIYVSTWLTFSELSRFADPCVLWGHQSGMLAPSDACPSVTAISETKLGVLRRLLLIQGTAILSACLGLIGAYRSWPKATLLGAVLLFLLSIPLMVSYGPFVFGLAILLLASSMLSRTTL